MITRDDIVCEARSWIGTPFVHQHRQRGHAVDCAGLLIGVARALGIVAPDFDVTGYSPRPDGVSLRAYCDEHLLPSEALHVGGVALVAWRNGPPQHLGIVTPYSADRLAIVHAEGQRHRKVIETRLVFGREMQLVAAYSFPGVA